MVTIVLFSGIVLGHVTFTQILTKTRGMHKNSSPPTTVYAPSVSDVYSITAVLSTAKNSLAILGKRKNDWAGKKHN